MPRTLPNALIASKFPPSEQYSTMGPSGNEIWRLIFQFVGELEALGLCRVDSKVKKTIQLAFGYDPINTSSRSDPWSLVSSLGMRIRNETFDSSHEHIWSAAKTAYLRIHESIRSIHDGLSVDLRLGKGSPAEGLSRNLTVTNSKRRRVQFTNVNCCAVIGMQSRTGEQTFSLAVNFVSDGHKQAIDNLFNSDTPHLSLEEYRNTPRKHAEIRLAESCIESGHTCTMLTVDKLFCVFCASQLMALGINMPPGSWVSGDEGIARAVGRRGRLQWYCFSPIIMFYSHLRQKMWGPFVERQFQQYSTEQKRIFLICLAAMSSAKAEPNNFFRSSQPNANPPRSTLALRNHRSRIKRPLASPLSAPPKRLQVQPTPLQIEHKAANASSIPRCRKCNKPVGRLLVDKGGRGKYAYCPAQPNCTGVYQSWV